MFYFFWAGSIGKSHDVRFGLEYRPGAAESGWGVAMTPRLNKHYTLSFEAAFAKVSNPANDAPPQANIG
jgi:adenine specific DNA methylase Mod